MYIVERKKHGLIPALFRFSLGMTMWLIFTALGAAFFITIIGIPIALILFVLGGYFWTVASKCRYKTKHRPIRELIIEARLKPRHPN